MNVPRSPLSLACAVLAGLAFCAAGAQAQTAAPKPARPAASQGGTASMGNAAADAPILGYEQLRQCLLRRDELAAKREALKREREELDRQRAALDQEGEALKAERAGIDKVQGSIAEMNERARAFNARVEAYQKRVAEAQAGGKVSPETVKSLEAERVSLNEAAQKLQADQDALGRQSESSVKAFNDKAQARDARASQWNEASNRQIAEAQAHDDANDAWKRECGNRRYREDDEKAIRSGK